MMAIAETPRLTTNQRQLLKLLADGKTRKEIARLHGVTPGTIGVRLDLIYKTLGVHNWRDACIAAGLSAHVEEVDPGTTNVDVMGEKLLEVVRKHKDDKLPTLGLIVDAARAMGVEFAVKQKELAA
jgi:DNA-binding CsgD family transcriptional regulator